MRRGDTSPQKTTARQRYYEKVRYNRIVGQLNQLHQAGFTAEDIRNAGPNAYRELLGGGAPAPVAPAAPQPTTTTVKEGDTPETVAQKTGTTPVDLLNANPEVKQFKTGMVLNLPSVGSEGWRVQQGIGLPSNAARGATTTNPQGANAYRGDLGYGRNQATVSNPYAANPYAQKPGFTNMIPQVQNFKLPGATTNTAPTWMNPTQNPTAPGKPQTPPTTFTPTFRTKDDYYPAQLAAQINLLGRVPTEDELKYLEKYGMITKAPQPAYQSGGYSRRRGGGRGRGRGRGGNPKIPSYAETERAPAFASGSGFNGLVNWRI